MITVVLSNENSPDDDVMAFWFDMSGKTKEISEYMRKKTTELHNSDSSLGTISRWRFYLFKQSHSTTAMMGMSNHHAAQKRDTL